MHGLLGATAWLEEMAAAPGQVAAVVERENQNAVLLRQENNLGSALFAGARSRVITGLCPKAPLAGHNAPNPVL